MKENVSDYSHNACSLNRERDTVFAATLLTLPTGTFSADKSEEQMARSPVYITKSFERLVLAYLKDITGPLLDPLQFAYRANRSVDDAVNMRQHFILQHLDRPGTYVRDPVCRLQLRF